ncbi:MAG TPA: dienelactone hydrolase family protein [Stellaceae bacterium]|nr:dienelactone hydrolase family protein [Stellaceae bacterium]
MDQRIIDLYDDFVHVHFDRRLFLERAAKLVGGAAAAAALLPLLQSNYALAAIVAEDDPRIATDRVTFSGSTGEVKAYLAKTKADGKHGGIVVVHQNRGLNPHIEDIARRLAVEGYVALAVDFLSPLGGTPKDEDEAMKVFSKLQGNHSGNAMAAADWLRQRPDVNGKIGAVGFCWGGGVVNQLAVADPLLAAGVAYYGAPPDAALVPKIKAVMLLHYADPKLDTRLGAMAPAYEAELKAAEIRYSLYYYAGANHGFNDDTQSARYDEAAAKLAWGRTLAVFKETLA